MIYENSTWCLPTNLIYELMKLFCALLYEASSFTGWEGTSEGDEQIWTAHEGGGWTHPEGGKGSFVGGENFRQSVKGGEKFWKHP